MKDIKTVAIVALLAVIIFMAGKNPEVPPQNQNFAFKIITVIESVMPGGSCRSRIITTDQSGNMEEIRLRNFYGMLGIDSDNIKNNDLTLADQISGLYAEGWELVDVTSGTVSTVEADVSGTQQAAASGTSTGIFISRYLFKRAE